MWRSLLFIPVLSEQFLGKAHQRGADAIILDLEDSIAKEQKALARDKLAGAIARIKNNAPEQDIVVRINSPWRLAVRDLEKAVLPDVKAIMAPKVAGPDHIQALDELITELEIEQGIKVGAIGLLALIETPQAFLRMQEIAYSGSRLWSLSLGGEDFAAALGTQPTIDSLNQPHQQLVIAAKAAGKVALGYPGSVAEFQDLDEFRKGVELGRLHGCEGGSAIHPAQVAVLNDVFTPSQEEVDFAERCVAAYEQALQEGKGAISLDGKMLDVPVVEQARNVLARAKRFS